jgi:hypothetical protein
MRKPAVMFLVLAFIGLSVAPFLSVNANTLFIDAPAPANVFLHIRISSPEDNASYSNGTVNLCFNVTLHGPNTITKQLYAAKYEGDWMQEAVWCPYSTATDEGSSYFRQYDFNVTDIPFGEHSLNITARAGGEFTKDSPLPIYIFSLSKILSVKFSVRTNPVITFPSLQNVTFDTSSVPLNFTIDHQVTEVAYCLDGQDSVSIDGNTTLTGLSNGQHNVTVYATDSLGRTDVSDMQLFYVEAPELPVVPFIAVSAVVIVSAVAGVLIYFKKRKR